MDLRLGSWVLFSASPVNILHGLALFFLGKVAGACPSDSLIGIQYGVVGPGEPQGLAHLRAQYVPEPFRIHGIRLRAEGDVCDVDQERPAIELLPLRLRC